MVTPLLEIDARSQVPPYRQLAKQVIAAISTGSLIPGERLPTVRALATELGIAPNTVASAYRTLEELGTIEGRGRAGTFVALGDDPIEAAGRSIADRAARELLDLGLDAERAQGFLSEALSAAGRPETR